MAPRAAAWHYTIVNGGDSIKHLRRCVAMSFLLACVLCAIPCKPCIYGPNSSSCLIDSPLNSFPALILALLEGEHVFDKGPYLC